MYIRFWGVRGSLPSTLNTIQWAQHFKNLMNDFLKLGYRTTDQIDDFVNSKTLPVVGGYGTATTCVEVLDQNQSLIIDMGSGVKNLNDELQQTGKMNTTNEFHILMSHFHFDHILGIPFFAPHFMKGKTLHYYSVQTETEQIVRQMFQKPTFPVTFENLQAKIQFHILKPYEKNMINGFQVTAYKLDHPDPCYGFRIEKNGHIYAHAVDHEAVRTTAEELGLDAGLFQNANLLYFDAQYEESEMSQRKGWGHGTCDRGFKVSTNFGIQQILFAHHDPSSDLQKISNQKKNAEKILNTDFKNLANNSNFQWDYAFEGQVVQLK